MKTFSIISLGCPRNQVDSEVIAGSLKAAGFRQGDVEDGVDVCVVNTCAFIESAREESVEAIIAAADYKKKGKVKRLVICGCLPQLYKEKLAVELPEADLILGTNDVPVIADLIDSRPRKAAQPKISQRVSYLYDEHSPRLLFTPKHYAYIKISEGCANACSYCIIPRLRGASRSRTVESVLAEIRNISSDGLLKEVILIGQDTTAYGIDRYGAPELSRLLRAVCAQDNSIRWARLMYTHPAHYTDELIDTIGEESRICKYLDLPIQHISGRILKLMNRKCGRRDIECLLRKLRKKVPGLILRTSVIVGFPGETDGDFKELLGFLKEAKFGRLGAFIYSREEGTRAARLKGHVSNAVKRERYDAVMRQQQGISARANRAFIGKCLDVLVDEKAGMEKGKYIARTQGDAPEIDGAVYITGKNIKAGEFCKVKITDALEYDLVGEKVQA
ncbi:MAG: 30S ribosomal protein S12 methylthiotransferase RimO [Candidatus Omnitrophica bacterium]|nr:30S ribosomal protein S12 methylthiotransferase RimO [Candidatus Omnitrophota bacterium]